MTPNPLTQPERKLAGLLVPVFALRHSRDFGIGDTTAMRETIQFCAAHRLAVLQILPIHECVGDHSPYNAISSRALSPALLTLTEEEVPGLSAEALQQAAPDSWLEQLRTGAVRYNSVQPLKLQILLEAHYRFRTGPSFSGPEGREFADFQEQNKSWLPAYTLFRLLIREYEGNPNWNEWRPAHQTVEGAEHWLARHPDREDLQELREGYAYVQWVAYRQWRHVRQTADDAGVLLMGEMSFGVSRCSVDCWQHPDLFDLTWNMGTQPVRYFDTNKDSERWGQNWGLPCYRWENHRSEGFLWLRERLQGEKQFFHLCRLDHLRGYFRAYMFPWSGGARHAEFAQLTEEEALVRAGGRKPRFVPGPDDDPVYAKMNDLQGRELIQVMRAAAGDMYLIAEIMGNMTDYMHQALEDLHLPSLTFPQLERQADRTLQPISSFRRLSLATYANHDHAPLATFYTHLLAQAQLHSDSPEATDLKQLLALAGWSDTPPETLTDPLLAALIQKLFQTPCQLAVLMSSDLLGLPQRFNLPGSYGAETWCERLAFPLAEYARHPVFGPRIATVQRLITETGRQP
jgi:4-alpha-glucanotransferase